MTSWNLPLEGGCRCDDVRLRAEKPPILTGACHCAGCQKMTGSAFSLTISFPGDALRILQGEPVIGGAHGPVAHHFHCPRCKAWLFTRAEGMDWFVNVRASVFDDHRWFVPFVELWLSEKLPWATTPALHGYETVPELEEFGALMAEFKSGAFGPG